MTGPATIPTIRLRLYTSGIDVRIITPRISDHWFVHVVTQSNYGDLLEASVRIYEYTPGYIHAKTIMTIML